MERRRTDRLGLAFHPARDGVDRICIGAVDAGTRPILPRNLAVKRTLFAYRLSLGLFIAGLIVSGLTAFPLLRELSTLCRWLGISDPASYATLTGLSRGLV